MSDPQKGVVIMPPAAVHIDVHKEVMRVLQDVPDGHTMAALRITTDRGVNLAIAHRETFGAEAPVFLRGGHWGVELWVGKSGWNIAPPAGGVTILFSK